MMRPTFLGLAFSALLATAACRNTESMIEPMADVIAINVLLEPDANVVRTAKQANRRLLASTAAGFALDDTHAPHISLLHRYVSARELPAIYAAVDKIAARLHPQDWTLIATGYETGAWESNVIVSLAVQRSPELARLQVALVEALAPYAVERGDERAFVRTLDSMHLDPSTIEYVASFVPQRVGTNFSPHITIGLADEESAAHLQAQSFRPIPFHPAAVAVYQLGNVGTARKKLHQCADR